MILRVAWHGPRGGSPGHIRRRGPVPQKLDLFFCNTPTQRHYKSPDTWHDSAARPSTTTSSSHDGPWSPAQRYATRAAAPWKVAGMMPVFGRVPPCKPCRRSVELCHAEHDGQSIFARRSSCNGGWCFHGAERVHIQGKEDRQSRSDASAAHTGDLCVPPTRQTHRAGTGRPQNVVCTLTAVYHRCVTMRE